MTMVKTEKIGSLLMSLVTRCAVRAFNELTSAMLQEAVGVALAVAALADEKDLLE